MRVLDVEQGGAFLSLGHRLNTVQQALTASFRSEAVSRSTAMFYDRWRTDFARKFFAGWKKDVYVRQILSCVYVLRSRG